MLVSNGIISILYYKQNIITPFHVIYAQYAICPQANVCTSCIETNLSIIYSISFYCTYTFLTIPMSWCAHMCKLPPFFMFIQAWSIWHSTTENLQVRRYHNVVTLYQVSCICKSEFIFVKKNLYIPNFQWWT